MDEVVEIYSRDVAEYDAVKMFFDLQLYVCKTLQTPKPRKAQYFAPYFAQKVRNSFPTIQEGFTYIAVIKETTLIDSWKAFKAECHKRKDNGQEWMDTHTTTLNELENAWSWDVDHTLFFLGEPRLVFNPPILKRTFGGGSGQLAKHYFSFDNLYEAWNHKKRCEC